MYALAGATASATTGSDGLTVTMKAKVAVLRIVGVNNDDIIDINVRTADGKYVSGLTAVRSRAGFRVDKSDTKVSLLSKQGAGVYYVVVPAGEKISVSNGDKSLYSGDKPMSTTKADGLKAGKYYTLTTGMTKGKADNSLGQTIEWVQLWAGGPKFAKENVASKMTWKDATKTGADYVWGANWRTPTKDEMTFVDAKQGSDGAYTINPLNTKVEVQVQNGVTGILYTGIQPGYTDKTLFLPGENSGWYYHVGYWTSTEIDGWGSLLDIICDENEIYQYHFNPYGSKAETTKYLVRPVLVEK